MVTDRGESEEPLVVRKNRRRVLLPFLLLAFCAVGGAGVIACHSQKTESPRYHLTGKISDVDRSGMYVLVEQDDIPGFMPAMTMSYPVKDPHALEKLSAGDQISADVVVGSDGARLENISIVKKGTGEGAKPAS